MGALFKIAVTVVMLLYPLAVYFGLKNFEPKDVGIWLAFLVLIRSATTHQMTINAMKGLWVIILLAGLSVASYSFNNNSALGLKLYPVVITSSFLFVFAYSLIKPPTFIERLARIKEPDLTAKGIAYTRKITIIWCLFFILNIGISLYTAFYTSLEVWTLYNGLLSYILMGCLFFGEIIYRKWFLQVS